MVYLSFLEVEYQSDLLAIYTLLGDCATDPCFSSRIVGVCRKPTPPTKIDELACLHCRESREKKKGGPTCQRRKHQSSWFNKRFERTSKRVSCRLSQSRMKRRAIRSPRIARSWLLVVGLFRFRKKGPPICWP